MAENSQTFLTFKERWQNAIDAGLEASAEVYAPAVKAELQHGYTSGHYADAHQVASSVQVSHIRGGKRGRWIRVFSNVPFAAFWELGHHNIFTKKFERVEHWRATAMSSLGAMSQAFRQAFSTALGA